MCFVDSFDIHASMKHVWAPPLTEVQRYFKHSNAIEIRDRITFSFYTGLPHMYFDPMVVFEAALLNYLGWGSYVLHIHEHDSYLYVSPAHNQSWQYSAQMEWLHQMWQSQTEIKYYSIAYFERIAKFDAL